MNREIKKDVNIYIQRIKCDCGQYNNPPSNKRKKYEMCPKCGKLIDMQERFKRQYKIAKNKLKENG